MKGRLVFVLFMCVTISGYFLATTEAQTTQVRSNHVQRDTQVQPDIPGLVAELVAQALAAEGYEAYLDGRSVTVDTHLGELVFEVPETDEALRRGELLIFVDGELVVPGDYPAQRGVAGGLFDCIGLSLNIWENQLDICDLTTGTGTTDSILCIYEASFELVLNILRCVLP